LSRPATGHGVCAVSSARAKQVSSPDARRLPRRTTPSGVFPSPTAASRHRDRYPPVVTLTGRLQGLAP
jgi:hypothetical protein